MSVQSRQISSSRTVNSNSHRSMAGNSVKSRQKEVRGKVHISTSVAAADENRWLLEKVCPKNSGGYIRPMMCCSPLDVVLMSFTTPDKIAAKEIASSPSRKIY